jgi:crotonobetaine/carnitine-CoA ligase
MTSLATFAQEQASRYGDRSLALVDGVNVTYAELAESSAQISTGLKSLGIIPGDRVAIMMANSAEFLYTWFGILGAGAIEVPIHDAARGDSITYILETTGAKALVVDSLHAQYVAEQAGKVQTLEHIIVAGDGSAIEKPTVDYAELFRYGASEPVVRKGSDPASILFTGGTTGPPKGAVLPHGHNLNLAKNLVGLFGYTSDDVLYTAFPLFHANAKYVSFLTAMAAGARVVIDKRFSATNFWDTCREHGVTAFAGMGEMLRILLKREPSERDKDNPVRMVIGAAASADLIEEFEDRFDLTTLDVYGLTETGPAAACTWDANRRGSMGRPTPWYEVAVVDEDDLPVEAGEVGELIVRPRMPHVMMVGYWGNPEATLKATRNLWFHTGDRVAQDDDGYLWFKERDSDSIRRRGENVSAWEVERIFADHPDLLEATVYGVPAELGGQEVMLAAVPKEGRTVTPEQLLEYCEGKIAHFAIPRYVRFVKKLPRNHAQRVLKHVLKADGTRVDGVWDREVVGYEVTR